MMSLPYTLLPTLILTDTPTPLPLSADQMVMPLVAVESATGALPSDVGIVIVAAPDVPQTTIATLRKRYTWQPLMLFTDVDGKSVWEEKYGLLLLPLALWQHLTTPEVLSTYIDMAEMQRLQDIGQSLARTIHSIADPQRQLTHLAEALRHIIPFDGLNMFMMEEDLLRMLFHYGYEDTPGDFKEHMRLPKQYASQLAVMKQGEVKLIANVWHSEDWEPGDKPSLNWIQSWLGIPLWRYGEVVGLIGLDGRVVNQFVPLHASRARYLEETISALVVAIDLEGIIDRSSHLLKAIRRQNQLMSVQFADATSIEGVCRAIAETVVNVFGQTDCGVMLLDDTRTELIRWARAGDYDVQATAPLYLDGDGLAVEAVRSGETIYAPDVDADHRYVPNEPRTRAELAIPLRLHDDIMGVLDLQSTEYHAFTHMDREALTVFADHAATAIENVRLELLAPHDPYA
ncbi:MAG: GAF domain-containing protein [Chloroflexota bacterium]